MICVLGDAHLDVVVRLHAAPAEETDTPATTALGVGGQAANVAAWVVALGGSSRLLAARGTDPAAQLVAGELQRRGVELTGPVIQGRTGVVVSLADGTKRSMLTDRGVGPLLTAEHVPAGWLDGCDWLHLPGYSLVSEPIREAALAAASTLAARPAGGASRAASPATAMASPAGLGTGPARRSRLSIDLSSTAALLAFGVGRFRQLIASLRPDLVLGNEAEAALIGELPGTELVIKLGAAGVLAAGRRHPALPASVVDATGAGDAFAAGYLLGGVKLGLSAAARAVATMGAMP
ncbi:MAG TPA: PfkB family carbohydrate kinase [Streptosporangiaceae bacterium]